MLAYLFWHGPPPDVTAERYEAALAAFHGSLAGHAPPGFHGSAAFRVEGAPWGGDYEDWYLVEDWAALGTLNEAAVSAPRRDPHHEVAELSAKGAGGVYALVRGKADPSAARWAVWLDKPLGEPSEEFLSRIALLAGEGAIWQRQLVLGPAREFCALTSEAPADASGGLTLALAPVGRP